MPAFGGGFVLGFDIEPVDAEVHLLETLSQFRKMGSKNLRRGLGFGGDAGIDLRVLDPHLNRNTAEVLGGQF